MDAESVGKRLSYLESTVHSVGSLAVHTAKGVGKDRSSRQVVAFFVGQAKEGFGAATYLGGGCQGE